MCPLKMSNVRPKENRSATLRHVLERLGQVTYDESILTQCHSDDGTIGDEH